MLASEVDATSKFALTFVWTFLLQRMRSEAQETTTETRLLALLPSQLRKATAWRSGYEDVNQSPHVPKHTIWGCSLAKKLHIL